MNLKDKVSIIRKHICKVRPEANWFKLVEGNTYEDLDEEAIIEEAKLQNGWVWQKVVGCDPKDNFLV